MLNKLEQFVRRYELLQPGDTVVCAVSGGADSVALLFAMYLQREKWKISLAAAHYNHHLRGEESDRDEAFVKALCDRWDIPLYAGGGRIVPGKKGLEAAARDARYAFLNGLPGKIATAHTADDNAETVLMHLVRGTGLKGLGAIAPINGKLIRPMLNVTRSDVEAFLKEYNLSCVEDSSNQTDMFLRNRIRHQVMPILRQENPKLAENLSAMALRLRQDEDALTKTAQQNHTLNVNRLREMHPAVRSRILEEFLKQSGVPEPEAEHIALAENLVFSGKPSAFATFPGGVRIGRRYDALEVLSTLQALEPVALACPGVTELPLLGLRIICAFSNIRGNDRNSFSVVPEGTMVVRSREAGDAMRFPGGSKSLKKWFIDEKIPACQRKQVPVLADDRGVLGVFGGGANLDRTEGPGEPVHISFETVEKRDCRRSGDIEK